MNDRHLYKAKRLDNGEWIEGYYLYDGVTGKSYIHAIGNCLNESEKVGEEGCLKPVAFEVEASTLCQCTGKNYMDSDIAYEGDIFESQASGDLMILRYGTYQAYCPVDKIYMDSVGFYAECKCHPDMPIGCLEDYALKKGNVFDSPELLEVEE